MKKRVGLTLGAATLALSAAVAVAAPGDCDWGGKGAGYGGMHPGGMGMMQGGMMGGGMGMDSGHGMGHGMGQAMGQRMLERLDWALDLTPEQRQQVRDLIKQHHRERQDAAMQGGMMQGGMQGGMMQGGSRQLSDLNPGSDDYQQQLEELARNKAQQMEQRLLQRGKLHAEIYALLTPEQRQAWEEMHARKGPRQGGGGPHHGRGPAQ